MSAADARRLWSDAAREVLMDTACRYNAVITYGELGEAVQQQAGIRTSSLLQHWIGKVLEQLAVRCAQDGELLMTALCVKADGTVGHGYAAAVTLTGQPRPEDPEAHAADQRLACYRKFAADLPEDGGTPALATQEMKRRRETKAPVPRPVCPRCHLVLPRTGVCDTCD